MIGKRIVVLQRGWVYVGDCTRYGDILTIENAYCIRNWGTTKGLGELIDGPLAATKLDYTGTVECNMGAVINLIKVAAEKWNII